LLNEGLDDIRKIASLCIDEMNACGRLFIEKHR